MDNGAHEDSRRDFEAEVADVSRSGHMKASQSQDGRLSPLPWIRRLLTAVGIVALVLVLALDLSGQLNPRQFVAKLPSPLTLRPQVQGMICLVDAAWSPQGTRIALLGDQHAAYCPANTSGQKSGLVTIFDATSAKLLATLHPDAAIVPAIEAFAQRMAPAPTPAAQIAAAIGYQHVLWSPDGRRLALTFSLALTSIGLSVYLADGQPEQLHGALVLDTNGAHPQVIMQADTAYESVAFEEWDVHASASVAAPASPAPTFGVLLPALAYRWLAGAMPVAVTPLSSDAPPPTPPLGPVGNPDGESEFTIWQPGVVTGVVLPGPDGVLTPLPGVYELSATFEVWSPDSRYLLDVVAPDGLLELPGTPHPTPDQLSAYGVDGMPLLPLRDAGLAQALRVVNPTNPVGAYLAWRPDGRVLAAYAPEHVFAVPPVTVYDCATGRQLTALRPPALGDTSATTPLLGQSTLLRWSPEGRHLLLYALPLGQVVLWGPQQLPR